jgi:hypothetical protein
MSGLGHPDYKSLSILNENLINKLTKFDYLSSYISIKTEFEFPSFVKYPCIPCSLDEDTTIYPLKGESVITGLEYLTAKNLGCKFNNPIGVLIPFGVKDDVEYNVDEKFKENIQNIGQIFKLPYKSIISDLQKERRNYPKGTFLNLMYKEIANSIYGQVAKGISNKKTFDIASRGMISIKGGNLSNPILASHITSFIRCVIGECLNNIQLLNGTIVSVTTDGFITDVADLETKLLSLPDENTFFLNLYRTYVRDLSNGSLKDCLELKNTETNGLMS